MHKAVHVEVEGLCGQALGGKGTVLSVAPNPDMTAPCPYLSGLFSSHLASAPSASAISVPLPALRRARRALPLGLCPSRSLCRDRSFPGCSQANSVTSTSPQASSY